ncbi:hypothetical protein P3T76_010349 [Phytophthora citrophthora]|uniref:RxLR effector PexRD54 WY domain-containing protein n=1 Tax=Phytophthora citrophthora TaxID=4793 RepID=A0AAD9GC66_9STRA|nr:hypothetical protein P3T76_010349 [Phytophthora citrophthora]
MLFFYLVPWFTPLRITYQDNSFAKVIETVRRTPETSTLADIVEKARLEDWLTMRKPPKSVFHFTGLYKTGEKTFSSPNFELWVKYLKDFNHKYPAEKTTMVDSIRANYTDLHLHVVRILDEVEKIPSTEKLAKNLL